MTTVVTGLHPLVTSALEAHGCGTLTSVQHQTLSRATVTGAVPPDCIVETPRGSGHCLCMVAYAAHFVHQHTGGDSPFAIIVARDAASLRGILAVSNVAQIPAVRFVDVSNRDSSAKIGSQQLPLASRVLVGTLASLSQLDFSSAAHARASCVTLMVEEAAPLAQGEQQQQPQQQPHAPAGAQVARLAELIHAVNSMWPSVNLCLLSARPPSAVHASLRYLLRRNNRCYLPARSAVPVFTTILCLSNDDRAAMCHRVTQIQGLRRVLILTHNRDVKDLKTELHKALGLRTFAIQRATTQADRERVLTDFLERDFGVLVAMDAFTGVDLIDVDGVIQFYPPQKSMTDDEWTDYVSFLRTTGESGIDRAPACVFTLASPDDLSMIKHLQNRVGFAGPVLNISPNHVNFEEFVLQPSLAVLAKVPIEDQEAATGGGGLATMRRQYDIVRNSGDAAAATAAAVAAAAADEAGPSPSSMMTGGGAQHHHHQHAQHHHISHGDKQAYGGGGAAAPAASSSATFKNRPVQHGTAGGGPVGSGGQHHHHHQQPAFAQSQQSFACDDQQQQQQNAPGKYSRTARVSVPAPASVQQRQEPLALPSPSSAVGTSQHRAQHQHHVDAAVAASLMPVPRSLAPGAGAAASSSDTPSPASADNGKMANNNHKPGGKKFFVKKNKGGAE